MKKKFMILAFAVAILIGLVSPSRVEAADEKYSNITEFLESYGYETFVENENAIYVARTYSSWLYVHEFTVMDDYPVLGKASDSSYIYVFSSDGNNIPVKSYVYNSPTNATEAQSYALLNTISGKINSVITDGSMQYKDADISLWRLASFSSLTGLLYSDVNVYSCETNGVNSNSVIYYDEILVPSSKPDYYTFMNWCSDAELPNPSGHTFNANYYYLVTHNALGYFVTQVYADESINQFTQLVSYDNKLYLHLKDDISGTTIFVNRFNYINGRWSNVGTEYFTLEYGELTDLNVTVASNNKLCYSNNSIKTGSTYGNIYYSANTEFTEGFTGEIDPDSNPNATPTPTPSASGGSGSSSGGSSGDGSSGSGSTVGGNAKPGGMLEFVISFFTLVWTKLFAVEVPVDGYNISFQSIVIFGAVAGVLIWLAKGSFGKKG